MSRETDAINNKPRDIEKLLKVGNSAQREKLLQNMHKGSWEGLGIRFLFDRLKMEVEELEQEVNRYESSEWQCLLELREEAADVANFCHMIIHRCDILINQIKGFLLTKDKEKG